MESPDSASPAAFTGTRLNKIYRTGETEVHALRDVDLSIPQGEVLVLLGPSGSGKSTLLNILGGLDRPTSGNLSWLDHDLVAADEAALTRFRRAHVGFIFQFYNLIPSLTAEENVRLVTDIAESPMSPGEALERVGLADRRNHYPAQLSGGEQQRVAIARALAPKPAILFADEPTGNLDHATGEAVADLLFARAEEAGATFIMVTHDEALAARCRRIVRLADGRIASDVAA